MCRGNCLYCICPCCTLNQKDCCSCCNYEKRVNIPIALMHGGTILSQNNPVNVCWVITRFILTLFIIFCVIISLYWHSINDTINDVVYFFFFLTQWANLVAMFYFIFSSILTYKIYKIQQTCVDITTIAIEELSEYGLKTLIYIVEPCLVIALTGLSVVMLMYWGTIFKPHKLEPWWPRGFQAIAMHALVPIVATFDYYFSYKRTLYGDVMVAEWFGITFVIWSIIHYLLGMTDEYGNHYLYAQMNWDDPGTAIIFSFVSLAVIIPIHMFYTFTKKCLLYQCSKNNNMYGIVELKSDVENEFEENV
eukprot:360384_1